MIFTSDKFKILHRDKFTCLYCGAKPGSDLLEVDHLIPKSFGGSDNDENLACACRTCNRRKSNGIYIPDSMTIRTEISEDEEWKVFKEFGIWSIKFTTENVVVESSFGYWFGLDRAFEDWEIHIKMKTWGPPHKFGDFLDCLTYARRLVIPPSFA